MVAYTLGLDAFLLIRFRLDFRLLFEIVWVRAFALLQNGEESPDTIGQDSR